MENNNNVFTEASEKVLKENRDVFQALKGLTENATSPEELSKTLQSIFASEETDVESVEEPCDDCGDVDYHSTAVHYHCDDCCDDVAEEEAVPTEDETGSTLDSAAEAEQRAAEETKNLVEAQCGMDAVFTAGKILMRVSDIDWEGMTPQQLDTMLHNMIYQRSIAVSILNSITRDDGEYSIPELLATIMQQFGAFGSSGSPKYDDCESLRNYTIRLCMDFVLYVEPLITRTYHELASIN